MKVKVGERIFDSDKEPIMVILSDGDKKNIKNMLPTCDRYCSYPDRYKGSDILEWMKGNKVLPPDSVCECKKPQPNYPEMIWCDNCGQIIWEDF